MSSCYILIDSLGHPADDVCSGGARYFYGEYFHDVIVFDLDEKLISEEHPRPRLNMLHGVRWTRQFRLTPGVIGRARCLVMGGGRLGLDMTLVSQARDRLISREVLNSLIYTDGDQDEAMVVDDADSPGYTSE